MPAIGALNGVGCAVADGRRVRAGSVSAHDAHAGVRAQPVDDRVGVTSGQDVDWPAGGHVQQHGAVYLPAAQGEVVDPEDFHRVARRLGHRAEQVQQRVPTSRHASRARQPGAGPPGQRHRDRRQRTAQRRTVSGVWRGQVWYLLSERPAGAGRHVADEPAHRQKDHDGCARLWAVPHYPLVAAMHPRGGSATIRTLGCSSAGPGLDHDPVGMPDDLINGHVRQMREEKIETAPDSATRAHIGHPVDTQSSTRSSPEPMRVAGDIGGGHAGQGVAHGDPLVQGGEDAEA